MAVVALNGEVATSDSAATAPYRDLLLRPQGTAERAPQAASLDAAGYLIYASDQDGDVDVYAASADGRRLAALTRNRVPDENVVISPDGRGFAPTRKDRGSDEERAFLVSGDGRHERDLGLGIPVEFSPDGRFLALGRFNRSTQKSRVALVPVGGGRVRRLGSGFPLSFSPNGRVLAFSDDGRLGIIRLRDGARWRLRASGFARVQWSRDSRRIALSMNDGKALAVIDPYRRAARPTLILRSERDLFYAWIANGRIGFQRYKAGAAEIGVIGPDGGSRITIDRVASVRVWWSPRTNWVAYTRPTELAIQEELVVASADGKRRRVIGNGQLFDVRWSPSGRRLAVGMRREDFCDLLVVRPARGSAARVRGRRWTCFPFGWAPDENHLATGDGSTGLAVVTVNPARIRPLGPGNQHFLGWVRGRLPRTAPVAPPAPRIETASAGALRSHGSIQEIASDGFRVAALVGKARFDCNHTVAWTAQTRTIVRFRRTRACPLDTNSGDYNLHLTGTSIDWLSFECGNYCYEGTVGADMQRPNEQSSSEIHEVEEDWHPVRPPPPMEIHRGIEFSFDHGTIKLRRLVDGLSRTIRPAGGAVDGELEDAGLFYAFNQRRAQMPGRIVFVPFNQLLG